MQMLSQIQIRQKFHKGSEVSRITIRQMDWGEQVNFGEGSWPDRKIDSQSLEDMQVGYILQKYTLEK